MSKRLEELYMESSKHSNYQILPSNLEELVDTKKLVIQSRYEKERLAYIAKNIDFKDKLVLDIGGNTGFFTFEAYNLGAGHVTCYEGNKTHARFVEKAVEILKLEERIEVFPEYYQFQPEAKQYDVAFCLNVVHHLGDDFKDEEDMGSAKKKMISCINNLSYITDILVFQIGFNWCGKRDKCLFLNGTKEEMEHFLLEGTKDFWSCLNVGIAEVKNDAVKYEEKNDRNNIRIDAIGEFLNRPIFILKSKKQDEHMFAGGGYSSRYTA